MSGYLLIQADARAIPLRDESVDCVVTSPPYWGLRDYGVADQIGLEPLHDCLGWATGAPCGACWVCQMVATFREVRRVLRTWGTCWVNLGDTYSSHAAGKVDNPMAKSTLAGVRTQEVANQSTRARGRYRNSLTLPEKNLCGVPWRFALAMQADGWYLRSEIIWAKPNPMPESIKDRPTKAHEQIFLLTPRPRYYYDQEAVRQAFRPLSVARAGQDIEHQAGSSRAVGKTNGAMKAVGDPKAGCNLKTIWAIPPGLCKEAHFATFPERIPEICILAGTSARGNCPACGRPWERVLEREAMETKAGPKAGGYGSRTTDGLSGTMTKPCTTTTAGWRPTCACDAGPPVPAIVLDPFIGSGTTCLAAERLGRRSIGLDLSWAYLRDIAAPRLAAPLGRQATKAQKAGQLALMEGML